MGGALILARKTSTAMHSRNTDDYKLISTILYITSYNTITGDRKVINYITVSSVWNIASDMLAPSRVLFVCDAREYSDLLRRRIRFLWQIVPTPYRIRTEL